MPELTLLNIEEISRDVGRQEITFAHLRDELTDHICCDVEDEMRRGVTFAEAYNAVRKKMGSRRLREIQEETLYAVDTKYRKMKNTMKISGIAGTLLLGFAALFKIMHWPFAGIMLILGALIMSFVFMPSALTVLWKETHSTRRLFLYVSAFMAGLFFIIGVVFKIQHWPFAGHILTVAVLTGTLMFLPALLIAKLSNQENRAKNGAYITGALGIFSYAAGLLFKVQHWPWATVLLSAGLILIFIVAFPWYTRITWKDDSNVSSGFIYMVIGALAIIVPSLLVSLNLQRNYEGGYFMLGGQQQALYDYQSGYNRSFMNTRTDTAMTPMLASIHSGTDKLVSVIEGIEAGMNAGSEGDPFSLAPYNNFLKEGTAARTELNKALHDYSMTLSALMPQGSTLKFEELLDPAAYFPAGSPDSERISLMTGLHMLKLLKNGILTAESLAFSAVSQN
jgi:hypothetical protein